MKVVGLILLLVALANCQPVTPTVGPPTAVELASIPSNFNVSEHLIGSPGEIMPDNGAPDVVGAFRFICEASHEAYDDPVVFPGQPGKSHLHQFYGNTGADAFSTYESLRKTGNSTCVNKLNRSGYWVPAMLDGRGGVIRPDFVSVYYKRYPKDSPFCYGHAPGGCTRIPRGLRMVFGYDVQNKKPPPYPVGYFNCQDPNNLANGTDVSGHFDDIVIAATHCNRPDRGYQLGMVITAPSCWDGVNLDSPNHRDHMAYQLEDRGNTGQPYCPRTHPYQVPTFTLGIWYTIDGNLSSTGTWDGKPSTWHLSSDIPADGSPMMTPGSTLHADWFGAWDDDILHRWEDNCIDKLYSCNSGLLGDGYMMKEEKPYVFRANPRVVPVPPKPNATPAPTGNPPFVKGSASTASPLLFLQVVAAFAAVFYNLL